MANYTRQNDFDRPLERKQLEIIKSQPNYHKMNPCSVPFGANNRDGFSLRKREREDPSYSELLGII